MSIKIMSNVWKHSTASGSGLLVLLAVADYANDNGTAYPSIEALSKKARMSPRNTRYVVDELAKAGELTVERNAGPKGCNLYTIRGANFAGGRGAKFAGAEPSAWDASLAGGEKFAGGATGFREGVQPASAGAAIAIAAEPSVNVIEPSVNQGPAFAVPPWVSPEAWKRFEEMRGRSAKTRLTNGARKLIVNELMKLKDAGNDPNDVLNQSTRNSWSDVYPLKDKSGNGAGTQRSLAQTLADERNWQFSHEGVRMKAAELGITPLKGETWSDLKARCIERLGG